MAVSDEHLDELRSWAAGEPEPVDYSAVELPPCVTAVRDGASTVARRTRVVRAYYEPEITSPQLDREVRIADGQAVVVAPDGSILATWRVPTPEQPPVSVARPSLRRGPAAASSSGRGPADHAGLLRMLACEGVRTERTTRHIRVFAPGGVVYIASTPSDHRAVRNEVALLRRYGCTLRHDH